LFPDKKPQERVLNVASFISRYGTAVLPRLMERLTLDVREHQVVKI
jgi:uncharacterized protein YllA (UPF0747 family)